VSTQYSRQSWCAYICCMGWCFKVEQQADSWAAAVWLLCCCLRSRVAAQRELAVEYMAAHTAAEQFVLVSFSYKAEAAAPQTCTPATAYRLGSNTAQRPHRSGVLRGSPAGAQLGSCCLAPLLLPAKHNGSGSSSVCWLVSIWQHTKVVSSLCWLVERKEAEAAAPQNLYTSHSVSAGFSHSSKASSLGGASR
jgi:hypothetical protein